MKLYRVTFDLGYGEDKRSFSQVEAEENAIAAKNSTKAKIFILTQGTMPQNVKANAIVFGADGKGKSLNKLKKK